MAAPSHPPYMNLFILFTWPSTSYRGVYAIKVTSRQDRLNRSSTTYSVQIFPLVHGEDKEEPDFQDDQPPTSIGDQGLSLLDVH